MYRSNIYPKLFFTVSLLVLGFSSVFAQLELKLQLIDDDTWGVYARPNGSITPSTTTTTGSGQVTVVMPATFVWTSLTSVSGQWQNNATVVAPPEDPTRQYVSFGLLFAEPAFPIIYQDGEETLLFTFKRDEPCPDTMYLIDCNAVSGVTDPFCPDYPDGTPGANSANSNPGNDLSVVDFGVSPTGFYYYYDNYAYSAWSCHDCDGDGILNGLEDTNGNGTFDVGIDTSNLCDPCDPIHVETASLNFLDGLDVICAGDLGDTAYLSVDIFGGWTPYTVILNNGSTLDTFTNYYSGDTIAVIPTATTVYTIETVIDSFLCEINPDSLDGAITITVEGPISFTDQPDDVTECSEDGNNFCVTAANAGDGTIFYKWQVSEDNGATYVDLEDGFPYDSTDWRCLFIDETAGLDNNLYRAKIWTSTCDTVYSDWARLDVEGPISVADHPDNIIVCDGANAFFTAAGANPGDGTLLYQWQLSTNGGSSWGDVSGGIYSNETTTTVNLTGVDVSMDGYQYRMKIYTATCDTIYTNAAILDIEGPLTFSLQPQDFSNCAGSQVFFNFIYDNPGLGTVTYHWQENDGLGWVNLVDGDPYSNTNGIMMGASNGDTLGIADVIGLDGYQYRVCITTPTCSTPVCSDAATLTVSGNAEFTQQPPVDPIKVCAGSDTTIVACASIPQGSFYFTWEYSTDDGTTWDSLAIGADPNLSQSSGGASMASGCDTLIINDVQPFTGWWFRAVANASDCSGVTSEEARLLVEGPLSVTTQPTPVTECAGEPVQFLAEIANAGDPDAILQYNWQVTVDGVNWTNLTNGTTYAGVTTPLLLISDITGQDGFCFRLAYGTSTCNDAYTNSACLTVEGPIIVDDQPEDVVLCYDDAATFISDGHVVQSGTIIYQWQVSSDNGVNWNDITGATDGGVYSGYDSNTLSVSSANGLYGRCYRLEFTTGACNGSNAVYSDVACMRVQGPITITDQPDDIWECSGDPVFFIVDIDEASPDYTDESHIQYLWQESTNGGATWTNLMDGLIANGGSGVNGVNTDTLGVIQTIGRDDNQFRVLIWTQFCDTLISDAATLYIEGPITFTDDPDNISECQGSGVTFQATTANPGLGTIQYQWERSCDDGASWVDLSNGGPHLQSGVTTTTLVISQVDSFIADCRFRLKAWTLNCDTIYSNYAVLTVEGPIIFNDQPDDQTICSGSPVCFEVEAENLGAGLITYQWQISVGDGTWTNLPNNSVYNGTKTANFCISNVVGLDSTYYRVLIQTQNCAVVVSDSALLAVEGPITFTDHPDDITQCSAEEVIFVGAAAIQAGNSGTISYQWQHSSDGVSFNDIVAAGPAGYSGWTTDTLTVANVAGLDGWQYRLVAYSGVCNRVYSFDAMLNVEGPLSITAQPDGVQNCDDAEALFTAQITNPADPGGLQTEYQWQILLPGSSTWENLTNGLGFNGVNNFAGTNTDTLLVTPLTDLNGSYIRMKGWTGTCDTLTTDSVLLAVEGPLTFTDHPDDVTLCSSSNVCFTIAVDNFTGVGTVQYQWQVQIGLGAWTNLTNTAPYSGVNTNQLCISNTANMYNYKFRCGTRTGQCEWEYSDLAQLFVEGPIAVDLQPTDQTICSNRSIILNTEVSLPASSSGALNLQWQYSDDSGASWYDLSDGDQTGFFSNYSNDVGTETGEYYGTTSEDLTITLVEGLDDFMYRLVIWTSTCHDTTDEITLTVLDACSTGTCDFDLDGQINDVDLDDDNDQLSDAAEDYLQTNNVTDGWNYIDNLGGLLYYSNCDTDSDNDGIPDNQEDPDGDEINNGEETDGDGVFDGDPLDPCDPVLGPTCIGIRLAIDVKLQGPKLGTSPLVTNMRDDLRVKEFVPGFEPYTGLTNFYSPNVPPFQHHGDGGYEYLDQLAIDTVFSKTGNDAVVDWVFVEIRSSTALDSVITTRAAFLQRDGDVVDLDGVSDLGFINAPAGSYFVSVRHRNHLGIMTAEAMDLSPIVTEVDFTDPAVPTYGDYGQIEINGVRYLWAGDLSGDGRTIYQGPGNDITPLSITVIADPDNTGNIANWISAGYYQTDVNLDGNSIYQGPNNDRSLMLFNTILSHPANVNNIANYVILEVLP